MNDFDWEPLQRYLLQLEQEGLVTRTYRRLDPERQQAVLHAILDEASQRGPAAVNIQNVARRAGVSVGSLYQYFGDREHMLDFAVELCARYTLDIFRQSLPYLLAMDLREALTAYLSYGIEWSRTQAGLFKLFARAAYTGDPELAEKLVLPIAEIMRQTIVGLLEQAARRGELRPDLDIEATGRLVHTLLTAAGDAQLFPYLNHYFQVVSEDVSPERSLQAIVDLIMRGIENG